MQHRALFKWVLTPSSYGSKCFHSLFRWLSGLWLYIRASRWCSYTMEGQLCLPAGQTPDRFPGALSCLSRFAPGAPQPRSPAGSLCADLWSAGRPGSNPGTVLIKTEEWKVEDTGRAIFFTSLSNLDQLRLCSFKPAPSLPHLTGCTQQPRIPKPHEHLLLHQREVGRCKRLSLLCLKISEAGAFP